MTRSCEKRAREEDDCLEERTIQTQKRSRFSIDELLDAAVRPPPILEPIEQPIGVPDDDADQFSSVPSEISEPSVDVRSDHSPSPSPYPDFLKNIECRLEGAELWTKFFELGTEMIITKSGRRMFPTVKVSVHNIDLDALYYVFLDVVPVDNKRYRYIYNKSSWLTAGKAEPAPKNRVYMHPDSPFTGEQLLKQVVSFEKAKLTNNEVDKTGHLILNSMHKYQPRIHIVRRDRGNPIDNSTFNIHDEPHRTYAFPDTQFMAVTAYQNQLITKLKIEKNPFAKGFRDPSGRSPDYEPEHRNEMPNLVLPQMYNPAVFQQALLNQYWLGKAAVVPRMPQLNPALLSQMLLAQLPMGMTFRPSVTLADSVSHIPPPSPTKSD